MSARDWNELLEARQAQGLMVCVGLDSDPERIPVAIRSITQAGRVLDFNWSIIEQTQDIAGAYKPNSAFYEALGPEGLAALRATNALIHEKAPEVPVIWDAKRGDIGATNKGYVQAFVDSDADAITVNPYLGAEGLEPFLARRDKGVIVLCRTSNKGAKEFQDRIVTIEPEEAEKWGLPQGTTMPFYQLVAWRVSREWNSNGNCALVVGATYPEELAKVRSIVEDMPILIPGIGTQGGNAQKVVIAGRNSKGHGMLINSSSGLIYASQGPDFAAAARTKAVELHETIRNALAVAI